MNAPAGQFAHKLPCPDYEPQVSQAWRAIDKMSLAESTDLAPHHLSLIEIREKLDAAIAIASGEPQ